MELDGQVRIAPFGGASKSANPYQAYLEADDGRRYRLRRRGGNPMRDPELERLAGRRVRVTGVVHGDLLLAERVLPLDDPQGKRPG